MQLNQAVILFASSRNGEEALFLKEIVAITPKIRGKIATDSVACKYLIVPRHSQRFDEVEALVIKLGYKRKFKARCFWRKNWYFSNCLKISESEWKKRL